MRRSGGMAIAAQLSSWPFSEWPTIRTEYDCHLGVGCGRLIIPLTPSVLDVMAALTRGASLVSSRAPFYA
jgi:hypothetical protein